MELNGVSAPVSPIQSSPIVQQQASPEPPESEPAADGEEASGKAKGVVSKLESGHFKGKGVADIRLRIAHFDNPDLEPIDPEELLPVPEDGPSKAYEKFLEQYNNKYADWLAAQSVTVLEEPAVVAPEPETNPVEEPIIAPLPAPEEPIIAPLPVPEEPVIAEVPVDESGGILAALEELLETPPAEQETGTIDIVV